MIYSEISNDYQGFYEVGRNSLQRLHRHEQGFAYTRADDASKSQFWGNLISQSVLELIFYAILLAIIGFCAGQALMGQMPWYWGLLGAVPSAFVLVWRFNYFVESKRLAWHNTGIMRYRKGYVVSFPKKTYALGEMLELSFQQDIAAGQSLEHNSRMYMRLVCMEYSKYRVGTENRLDIATLWSSPTYIYHISKGLSKLRVDMQVEIPEDGVISKRFNGVVRQKFSLYHTNHEVIWILQLREEVETYERDLAFAIKVVPAEQQLSSSQEARGVQTREARAGNYMPREDTALVASSNQQQPLSPWQNTASPLDEASIGQEPAPSAQVLSPEYSEGRQPTAGDTAFHHSQISQDISSTVKTAETSFLSWMNRWSEKPGPAHMPQSRVFTEDSELYLPKEKIEGTFKIIGAIIIATFMTALIHLLIVPLIMLFLWVSGLPWDIAVVVGIVLLALSLIITFVYRMHKALKDPDDDMDFYKLFQPARVMVSSKECTLGSDISLKFLQMSKVGLVSSEPTEYFLRLYCLDLIAYTHMGETKNEREILWESKVHKHFEAGASELKFQTTFHIPSDAPVSLETVRRFGQTRMLGWALELRRKSGRFRTELSIPIHVEKPEEDMQDIFNPDALV